MLNIDLKTQSGFATPLAIILLFIITIIGIAAVNISTGSYQVAQKENLGSHARLAADAGLDYGIQAITDDNTWTPTEDEITLMNANGTKTTYKLSLRDGASGEKILRSIGKTYRPADSTEASAERKYEVSFSTSGSITPVGGYSILAGTGGLHMSNSATVVGNVYTGGDLNMSNSSKIVLSGPGGYVQVADASCGSGSDFPRLCTPSDGSGQPIAMTGSSSINGSVYANNQGSLPSMSNPGYVSGGVSLQTFPLPPDRQPIIDAINASGNLMTGSAASCSAHTVRTLPANVHITGNVTVSGSCDLYFSGDTWIDGSLVVSNNAKIHFSNSLTERPIIMIDGMNGLRMTGRSAVVANSSGIGGRFITYYSTDSTCSPNCTSVTGAALQNSILSTTIRIANNIESTEGSEFFAAWTGVEIGNNAQSGAIAGQKIILTNSVQIDNSSTLTLDYVSSGGSGDLVLKSYRRVY